MKIALRCHSILIEKSLKKFLKNFLVPEHQAQIIVSDHPIHTKLPVLRIGTDSEADLKKPFSKSQLMIRLEDKLHNHKNREALQAFAIEEDSSLDEKIEEITRSFVRELTSLIKEHYENR